MEIPDITYYQRSFYNLNQYMDIVKKIYPSAVISGTFYEWRDISKYRRVAGLHDGYDIALPSGTPVVAGWEGEVVDICPWYGQEYGVTVKSTGDIYVTYGHIVPMVKTGQKIMIGSIIGFVVIDHVDIKMKDSKNNYIDFGLTAPAEVLIEKKDKSHLVTPLKSDKYILKANSSINKEIAHMEYLKNSNIFYNMKIQKATKKVFYYSREYYKEKELFTKGCIARNTLDKTEDNLLKACHEKGTFYNDRIKYKINNMRYSLKVITDENKIAHKDILKGKFYSKDVKKQKILSRLNRNNTHIKLSLLKVKSKNKLTYIKGEGFPPLSLGLKESKISVLEKQLKEAEKSLNDIRQKYEKAQELYTLGYIARKELDGIGENYEKALANYRGIQKLLIK